MLAKNVLNTAFLILAGGQGTRMNSLLPKALQPLNGKALLDYHFDYLPKAPVAILVSKDNRALIENYLDKKSYFGRSSEQITLITQNELPLLDTEGNVLEKQFAPDGNGYALRTYFESGLEGKWPHVQRIMVIPVDNPLGSKAACAIIQEHIARACDVSIVGVVRSAPDEAMGVIVQNESVRVVEYSECTDALRKEFLLGYTGLICFEVECAKRIHNSVLPLHIAEKVLPETKQDVRKQEYFIFDLLPFADKVGVIEQERAECFAPIKRMKDIELTRSIYYCVNGDAEDGEMKR